MPKVLQSSNLLKISKINHHVRVDHQGPRSLDLFLTARQFFARSRPRSSTLAYAASVLTLVARLVVVGAAGATTIPATALFNCEITLSNESCASQVPCGGQCRKVTASTVPSSRTTVLWCTLKTRSCLILSGVPLCAGVALVSFMYIVSLVYTLKPRLYIHFGDLKIFLLIFYLCIHNS